MITWLRHDSDPLPPSHLALGPDSDAPGLLAAGGRLSTERLAEAYRRGIFPWYSDGQPVLWWSPDPRMVLRPANFRLTRSLRKTIARFARSPGCEVRIDTAFREVMRHCAATPRAGQSGTWIVDDIVDAYAAWHAQGAVHSIETWVDGALVGGLYGVGLGRMFFGESMFSHQTDASKIALAALVCFCRQHGIDLIDCQQNTRHLASLGAGDIPRADFEARVIARRDLQPPDEWSYHGSMWRWLLDPSADATRPEDTGT